MDRDSSLSSEHKHDNQLMDHHYNINRFEKAQKQRQQKGNPMDPAKVRTIKEHILVALVQSHVKEQLEINPHPIFKVIKQETLDMLRMVSLYHLFFLQKRRLEIELAQFIKKKH